MLVVWHFVGPNTSDDGYLLTMARVGQAGEYTANYFRWFGAPEAPFGWYYSVFGWLAAGQPVQPVVTTPRAAVRHRGVADPEPRGSPRLGRAGPSHRRGPGGGGIPRDVVPLRQRVAP